MTAAEEQELGKAMARLHEWWESHKRHSLSIDIGNRYGATCWAVRLTGVTEGRPPNWYFDELSPACGEVFADECSFFDCSGPRPPNVVFAASDDDDAWPFVGLAATINAAIDKAEELRDD